MKALPTRRSGVTDPKDAFLLAAICTGRASAFGSHRTLVNGPDPLGHENSLVSFEHRGVINGWAADVSATSASGMLNTVKRSMVQMAQMEPTFGKSCMMEMRRGMEVLSLGYGAWGSECEKSDC